MVDIRPFRGWVYDFGAVGAPPELLAPPYDVIAPEERRRLAQLSPHNVVHLILPESVTGDKYAQAASLYQEWQQKSVLKRETAPAIYIYDQEFSWQGRTYIRQGFISLIRIEDFNSGAVIPHERTNVGPKEDRLRLMTAVGANLSAVFSLYADEIRTVEKITQPLRESAPLVNYRDQAGVAHRLWRLYQPAQLRKIQEVLRPKSVFIADGHHRYETALAYRNAMRREHPGDDHNRLYNFVMMYFSNIDNHGLVILPTHRMVKSIPNFSLRDFETGLQEYFDVKNIATGGWSEERAAAEIENLLAQGKKQGRTVFGLLAAGDDRFRLLSLRRSQITASFPPAVGRVAAELDVTILQQLVFNRLLGLDPQIASVQEIIRYKKDIGEAVQSIRQGEFQLALFVNPTRIEQVKQVALAREIMPQKSTFFYPKILSGLVFNPLSADEQAPE